MVIIIQLLIISFFLLKIFYRYYIYILININITILYLLTLILKLNCLNFKENSINRLLQIFVICFQRKILLLS